MNKTLIDTDILSFFLKGNKQVTESVSLYLEQHPKLSISEITYYEILAGLTFKGAFRQIDEFESFVAGCDLLKLSISSLRQSAKVYAALRNQGITIGTADILISGIALANHLTLATNNTKHFEAISGLETVNWYK